MVSKAPRTSTVNSSPELTVIVGGVQVLTEKRVFGPVCPHVPLPMRCRRHAGYSTRAREGGRWYGRTKGGTLMCAGTRRARRDDGDKLATRDGSSGRSAVPP